VHSELSLSYTIETTDKPLNGFRNQIILKEANLPLQRDFIVFGNRTRYVIYFNNKNLLVEYVKEIINANIVNAIHCDFPTLACFQHGEEIGKICYVYVDDVIIFSENETEHEGSKPT